MSALPFFPSDLILDLAMLLSAQLSLTRFNLRRLLLSQLLLSASTLFALCLNSARFMHLPLMFICAAIVTGERRLARILEATAIMFCAATLAAGVQLLKLGLAPSLAGCALLTYVLRRHRHLNFKWNIELEIQKNGRRACVTALIDTGNCLREHFSGLPVLIVEADAAPELAEAAHALDTTELRQLPYGVLGSRGSMYCFRVDSVQILLPQLGARHAPDCWVAIFPGRIPGRMRALAPPEFAEATQKASGFATDFPKRIRRVIYDIFKRKAIHLWHGGSISQGFRLLHWRQ